ncbi:LPS assembly lipoprotein LptE [Frigidibacter sp. MR17.24]|uniref:LPS assembly lipoprotein LptE n=1 Tax=Frigidibacter sp. MR17.24 TaxID=3127345 RepID=UPI003012A9EC
MSSSDRLPQSRRLFLQRGLALTALGPLAACGFRPVYGTGGPAQNLVDRVRVDDPGDSNSFYLVERLEERLGRSDDAQYRLGYTIGVNQRSLGLTGANTVTRYNIDGTVNYRLTRAADGHQLATGIVRTFVSFSSSGTTVATASANADAYQRLMRLLADQIVNELIASSGRWSAT